MTKLEEIEEDLFGIYSEDLVEPVKMNDLQSHHVLVSFIVNASNCLVPFLIINVYENIM